MPSPARPLLRRSLQFVASRGLAGAARIIAQRLAGRLRPGPGPALPSPLDPYPHHAPPSIHPFDVTHGVDTSGFTRGEDLSPTPAKTTGNPALWATAYYGIAPSIFSKALETLEHLYQTATATPVPWSTLTFVDLGCGKGRALLLASARPFAHILGVELDPLLATTARANLAAFHAPWQQCRSLEVRTADATTLAYPLTPIVLYLYHPFLAPLLKRVLRHLERSLQQHPRDLWILYINPEADRAFHHFPRFHQLHRSTVTLAPEDQLADRFGSSSEEIAIFRYTPAP